MFNKKQRVISFLLIIALLLSLCPLAILSTAQASEDTFSPEKHYFDFSQYEFDTVTLEELAVFNSYKATTVNAYNATKNVGFWSLENDSNVTGGKYLKYVKDNNGNNGGLFNFLFVANATGNYQTNEKDKHIVLKANTPYSIKIRYKIENLEEEKYDLNLFAVATQGVATPNSCPAGNLVYIKEGLGNTDGWTEATYSFVTPETYLGNNNSLLLGFNPAKEGTTTRPSEGTKFTYSVSVDCVEINRLSTVRLNGVDSTGHKTTENIYGAVGDKINFPDKGAVIYGNYDEDTKAFLNPIDVANRFFANSVYEDFYYKDDTFDIESYNIDFSQYNLIVGTGSNGNVVKMDSNKWELISDSTATGGKYLKYEKYSDGTGKNWKPYYHFMANPTGAFSEATKSGAVKLLKDTNYVIKIRYKVENLDAAYDLDFYANFTQGVWSPNSFHVNNNVNIATGLSNTDGWVEKEYTFTTPAEYVGTTNSLIIGFYPTKAGTATFPASDEFGYSVSIDYLKIDRATSVVFMSDGEVAETVYGTPGDTITDFPAIKKNGYKFAGWYKDAECSVAADSVTLTNKGVSATLYSGWTKLADNAVINDETYPDWRDNNDIYNGFSSDNSDYSAGTSSFKYSSVSGETAYMLLNYNNQPLILADQSVYMLTFKYRLNKGSTASVAFKISSENKFDQQNAVNQSSKDIFGADDWQKAVICFTADAKNADALYFTISSLDTVWIDEIVLSTTSAIRLETNGGSAIEALKGTPGEKVELPTPVWSGHDFSGWYKDSELKIPATTIRFPSKTETVTVYAAWDLTPPDVVVDFENVPYDNGSWTNPQYSYNSQTMSFIKDEPFSGEALLRFNYVVGEGSIPYNRAGQSFAFYKDGKAVKVENKATYIMSFWYRVKSIDANVRVTPQTCTANNFNANAVNYTSSGYTISNTSADGQWHQATIVFTAEPKTDSLGNFANGLFLRINPLADKNAIVDFDYISLTKLDENTAIVSMAVDSDETQFVAVKKGEKVTLPTPARNNYIFRGWYSDSSFKNKIAGSVYTAEDSATLYAKWSLITASTDFEKYPDSWIYKANPNESNFRFGNAHMSISNSEHYGGKYSLRFNYDGSQKSKESMAQLYNLDDILVAGDSPVILDANSVYMATIRYKVKYADGTADIDFALAARSNYYADRTRIKFLKVSSADIDKGWQTATICFTANPKAEKADALYLAFTAYGSKADIYIDDFKIELLEGKSYIEFNANNNTSSTYSVGVVGGSIEYPETPVRKGYAFVGWYTDEGCTEEFTSKTYGLTPLKAYAKWRMTEALTDFENYPEHWVSGTSANQTNLRFGNAHMSISDSEHYDGKYSLRFNYDGSQKNKESMAQLYNSYDILAGNMPVILEADCVYMATVRYKVKDVVGTADIDFALASRSNYYANRTRIKFFTVSFADIDKGWQTATICFTANPKAEKADALYLAFTAYGSNAELYIDKFTIELLDGKSYIEFNANNNTLPVYSVGKTGKAIKFPETPVRKGYAFAGWYTDEGCTESFTGKNYSILPLKVYAKWRLTKALTDFENYPERWMAIPQSNTINFRFGNAHMSISDNEHYDGKYSLRFNYDGSQKNKESMTQLYNSKDILVADDTPVILEENCVYMATIRYKVTNAVGTADIDFALASRNNYYANRTRINFLTVSSADIGKGWQTATICFTAIPKKEKADALYLAFTANGSKAEIYIDDFELELLEGKSYIEFNSNNNTLPVYSIGKAGKAIKFPETPERKGYTFAGWYTDEGFNELFTGKTHGVASLKVYAKWVFEDSIVISFEDEAQRNLNKTQFDTTEISDKKASHGRYSLKLNKSGNTRMNASMLLMYDNQPVTVEDGATYVLTYDYYVVQNTGKRSGQTTPLPNVRFAKASNVWSGYSVPTNIWAINFEEECGKWFTGSIMFTAELKEPTGNALYFTVNYSENFVGYFDNLRLTRVNKGEGDIAVNLNPCGASDIGVSKLFYTGKAGEQIKLPTDLKKEGFTFIGWYEDTKFKKRIESDYYTILQSDTTIYAGWTKPKLYQDFESYGKLFSPATYKYLDMDYELYDASIATNSKENVHGGNYSIHRKGEDFHTACFQILPETSDPTKRLMPGLVYKISMWVKVESKTQETGAIKIACSQSPYYAWAIDGEWHNIAAMKDLKIGEWTKLTYTFYATDYYMSIQTPGNASIYFDDISFELLYGSKSSDCSQSVKVDEYITVSKNEDLSILDSEIDAKYLKDLGGESENSNILIWIILGGSAIILVAACGLIVIILRKRKKVKRV